MRLNFRHPTDYESDLIVTEINDSGFRNVFSIAEIISAKYTAVTETAIA